VKIIHEHLHFLTPNLQQRNYVDALLADNKYKDGNYSELVSTHNSMPDKLFIITMIQSLILVSKLGRKTSAIHKQHDKNYKQKQPLKYTT
jgi:hypothetical protein